MLDKLDFARTALLIIDMQNDFLHPEGYFAVKQGWPVHQMADMAGRIARVKEVVKQKGGKTLYTATGYSPDGCDAYVNCHTLLPRLFIEPDGKPRKPTAAVIEGTWGSEIIDELRPDPEDHVVHKRRFDAFYQTDLEMLLRQQGIKTLLITGVTTDVCVETTTRSAFARDFDVVILRDCVGSWHRELHEGSLSSMAFHCGPVIDSTELTDNR